MSLYSIIVCFCVNFTLVANGQTTEERFHDLFITAGYSTVFGAALGTACLGLTENHAENLKFVAIGASLGFIGGSILGTYMIFSPMLVYNKSKAEDATLLSLQTGATEGGIVFRPAYNYIENQMRPGQSLACHIGAHGAQYGGNCRAYIGANGQC